MLLISTEIHHIIIVMLSCMVNVVGCEALSMRIIYYPV